MEATEKVRPGCTCGAYTYTRHSRTRLTVIGHVLIPTLAIIAPSYGVPMQDCHTALHLAAANGHTDAVEALLAAGANKEAADKVRAGCCAQMLV
jgi:hypothetical protein